MPRPQAAVPFVNQKGQRSMKRVKVERYRPGKKPSYAADNQDEEYYTDEEEDNDIEEAEDDRVDEDSFQHEEERFPTASRLDVKLYDDGPLKSESDDSELDDPRMRKLKQLSNRSQNISQPVNDVKPKTIHSSDDETEEQIRERHRLARLRVQAPPIGTRAIFKDISDPSDVMRSQEEEVQDIHHRIIELDDTDDILGDDFMLTGLRPEDIRQRDDEKVKETILESIEKAKDEAILKTNLERKVKEDIEMDTKMALSKNDFSAHELTSINTDDESEEYGPEYEAWKKREINRILRYRSELIVN